MSSAPENRAPREEQAAGDLPHQICRGLSLQANALGNLALQLMAVEEQVAGLSPSATAGTAAQGGSNGKRNDGVAKAIIEQFLRLGMGETSDCDAFWEYFIAALARNLDRVPDDGPGLDLKMRLASYFLRAFLHNFYPGDAECFYWQAGRLRQAVFHMAQDQGLNLLPIHFYGPVPDVRALPQEFWSQPSEWPGIRAHAGKQIELLASFASRFRPEYEAIPIEKPEGSPPYQYYAHNTFYDSIDGYILYCMIRHFRPRRIVEIGSGNTTYLSAETIARNQLDDSTYACELTAIEPHPNEVLKARFPGLARLIEKPAQQVPLTEFEALEENDILFIDSSHVLAIGSDVQYEILEILPRLKKGVVVHFHDIFTPREYPREWAQEMNRYWTEQYILQAFLAFNDSFEVLLSPQYLHTYHPESMEAAFSCYHRGQSWIPAAFWIHRTK